MIGVFNNMNKGNVLIYFIKTTLSKALNQGYSRKSKQVVGEMERILLSVIVLTLKSDLR